MSAKDLQDEVGYWVRERERWFEVMENGRVRCKLNGHEMVPCLEALNAFVEYLTPDLTLLTEFV